MESSQDSMPKRRRFFHRRRLIRYTLFLLALVPAWLLISFVVARQLTRRPRALFDEPVPTVAWAKFRSVRLVTSDGQKLGAWYADPSRREAPSVILLHGNGGHRFHMLGRAELLASQGCAVLPVSLRAHGDSSGEINDIGYSARHDVIAAVEFLERERPGHPILILGTSMGAAAATFASEKLGSRVAGYILEAPYLDLKVAVRNRTRGALPIGLEWVAYQGLITVAPYILPDLDKISPREAIGGIPDEVPVLMITGAEDRKSTPEQVEAIFDRVRSHGKLVVFEKAGHLHYHETDPGRYRSELLDFVFNRSMKATAVSTSSNTSQ
jgi:alpha-beta hydrolase superfamily lysophospholipase